MELVLDDRFSFGIHSLSNVSILVFVELVLDGFRDANGTLIPYTFQSLFSWNLFLMQIEGGDQEEQENVSILVFVELVLDESYRSHVPRPGDVSILVFVELVLDDEIHIPTDCDFRFQSLFSWNLFLMMPLGGGGRFSSQVSILVFVELVLDVTDFVAENATTNLFQSLFSWNLFLMPGR